MKCRRSSYFGSSESEPGPAEPSSVEAQAALDHAGGGSSSHPQKGAPIVASP